MIFYEETHPECYHHGCCHCHYGSCARPVHQEHRHCAAADNAASLTDGIYTSSAQGCLSDVTVTVTVTGGRVTGVEIDASGETPELGGTAAETLADQLTKAGSTSGVDAVAGATMTSDAVFTAMDDCLSQAE